MWCPVRVAGAFEDPLTAQVKDVSLATEVVAIDYDPARITPAQIEARLRARGYAPRED